MGDLLQLVVSGTATGAIYALAALGFTLLWQAAGTINFAQGEFVMVPAFLMLFFMAVLGVPLWAAFLLACAVAMLLLGVGFKYAIVNPLIPCTCPTTRNGIAVRTTSTCPSNRLNSQPPRARAPGRPPPD